MLISKKWSTRGVWVLMAFLLASGLVILYGQFTGPRLESAIVNADGAIALRFNRAPQLDSFSLTTQPAFAARRAWQGSTLLLYPLEPLPGSGSLLVEGKAGPSSFSGTVRLPQAKVIAVSDGTLIGTDITGVTDVAVAAKAMIIERQGKGGKELLYYQRECACTKVITSAEAGWDIRQAIIMPDGEHVLIHQVRPSQIGMQGLTRLWVWSPTMSRPEAFWYQGGIPDGMWPTPEGAGVIVREGGRMTYVPFAQQGSGEVTFLGKYDRLLSMAQNGSVLLFGTQQLTDFELTLVEVGKKSEQITLPGQEIEEALLSPDGGTIYMLARDINALEDPSTPRQVWSLLRLNQVATQLTKDPLWGITEMALSPNGKELALVRRRPIAGEKQSQLVRMNLDTLETEVMQDRGAWMLPQWIQD